MKKTDLTFEVKRLQARKPRTNAERLALLRGQKFDTLQPEVVSALTNFTGVSIEDAHIVVSLAGKVAADPHAVLSDEEFALVESALEQQGSAEVKASWKEMVEQLNKED